MERLLIVGELAQDEDFAGLCARLDWEVVTAASKSDALELVQAGGVAVVMLCQCLGDNSSFVMLERIQAIDPRVEVVLVSCRIDRVELPMDHESMRSAVAGLEAGALDYLRRPVGVDQLRVTLQFARTARAERLRSTPMTSAPPPPLAKVG